MNEFAWFKLLVRGIGVLLLGLAIPDVVHTALDAVAYLTDPQVFGMGYGMFFVSTAGYAVARCAVGVYLLYGAPALVRYCTRDLGSRCPKCGYDLSGATSGTCPECGLAFGPPAAPETRPAISPNRNS